MDYFEKHRETLEKALDTIASRGYWSPYEEDPRSYDEAMVTAGQDRFDALLGKRFELDQPVVEGWVSSEKSPYGTELDITYPQSSIDALLEAAEAAMESWADAGPQARTGVCLEILDRLAADPFQMAHAVMQSTGQGWLMAFQAGGPHALDRGLEAVAYAYAEMSRTPATSRWEKPQGKRDPLLVDKTYHIVPRGVAVVIGCATFPTWNAYPGLFASLVTGNPVVVKPHPETVLPFAITVAVARDILAEAGFDPNLITLAVDTVDALVTKELVMDPRVAIVDFTGGTGFGSWLEQNVHHALVFTEKAGVNCVIVDSAPEAKGMLNNLSVSLSLYSGQMCTAPQNVFVPASGVEIGDEHISFDEVAKMIAGAVDGLLSDDNRASEILGAVKSDATVERMEAAASEMDVVLTSREIAHPRFPSARVRTPVIVKTRADDEEKYMRERFGPIAIIVATDSTDHSIELATKAARTKGALTWSLYSMDQGVIDKAERAAMRGGVSLGVNFTGGIFVNQSAAFSDFHVTGANPAGNASLTDPAFVANRFRVVGVRKPVSA